MVIVVYIQGSGTIKFTIFGVPSGPPGGSEPQGFPPRRPADPSVTSGPKLIRLDLEGHARRR